MNILHLCRQEKFTPPFIEFTRKHFSNGEHKFMTFEAFDKFPYNPGVDTIHVHNLLKQIFSVLKELNSADKIILHSYTRQFLIFYLQPWLWKKGYWVVWGGDLYNNIRPKKGLKSWIEWNLSLAVIRSLAGIITYIKGDYELARRTFGADTRYFECLMYPSNLYKSLPVAGNLDECVNIQVGNSASELNEHLDVLESMKRYQNDNVRIYCPLSYHGEKEYIETVIARGREIFGHKFVPLTNWMAPEEYLDLLNKIDIAIFAHKRQQGMGNTITLLGLGKKVYMRSDVAQYAFLRELGVTLFELEYLNLDKIDPRTAEINARNTASYFSEDNLVRQWQKIYGDNNAISI